ncbi:Uncharacterised protein [Mycobacteroides abscessus subsp. abscessus]|nr:Uncharacterised protein [Mycobacteroides abscessus subsp. abscessus]
MANEDDRMLVGDFKGTAAFAPMVNVPNVDLSGVNVDRMLDVVEIEIARRQATAAGIGYHAGTGFGKADLRRRDDSA